MLGDLLSKATGGVACPESPFKQLLYGWSRDDWQERCREVLNSDRFKIWNTKIELGDFRGASAADFFWFIVDHYSVQSFGECVDLCIDHTPSNLNETVQLSRQFPESRFIHIIRDGRACAASVIGLDWGPSDIATAASWWQKSIAIGLAAESYLAPEFISRVYYENLVLHPHQELERIGAELGLQIDRRPQRKGFNVPDYTRQQHRLVGSQPDTQRSQAWRNELKDEEIEAFEYWNGDLLELLGYELVSERRRPSRTSRLQWALRSKWMMKRNAMRNRKRMKASAGSPREG